MDVVIGANGEMGIGAAAQLHVACACEHLSEIPHGIIGHHFYEEDVSLAVAARHRRSRRAAPGRPRPRRRAERRRAAELRVSAGVQVFLYPEELEHVEPEALAAQVLELGCDAVSVAVAYHRGRRVFPRHRRVSVLTRTTLYVEPERARYGALVPEGVSHRAAAAVSRGVRTERSAVPRVGRRAPQRCACGRASRRGGAVARRVDRGPQPLPVRSRGGRVRRRARGRRRRAARARVRRPRGGVLPRLGALVHADARARAALGAGAPARHAVLLRLVPRVARAGGGGTRACGRRAAVRRHRQWTRRTSGACGRTRRRRGAARRGGRRQPSSEGGLPPCLRLRPAGAGGAPGRLTRLDCRCRRPPLRLRPACGSDLQERFAGLRALAGRTGSVSTNWTAERTELAADVERLAAAGAEGLALYNLTLVPEAGLDAFRAAAHAFRAGVAA